MTPLSFALSLSYLYFGHFAHTTDVKPSIYVRQTTGLIAANVGDNVTLQCFYEEGAVMFFWYKQTIGEKPRHMTTFYKHDKDGVFSNEFNIPRFRLDTGSGKNHLTISDLDVSDSATYYCIGSYEYDFEFIEGATVSVKGSGSDIKALVHQSASEIIQRGCTVHSGTRDGETSVYWFGNSEESHPGVMYIQGGKNDQWERKSNDNTCFYHLPMETPKVSHAWTECAVATCGHELLEKEPDMTDEVGPFILVYSLFGVLAFGTVLLVLLAVIAYKMKTRPSCQCTDLRSPTASSSNAADYEDADNLHYAALRVHKTKNRSTKRVDESLSECVYSSVRQKSLTGDQD